MNNTLYFFKMKKIIVLVMLFATMFSAKAQIQSLDEVSSDKTYTLYNPHYTSYAVYNAEESTENVWAAGMTLGSNPDREIADESYKFTPDFTSPSSSWMIVQYEGNWYIYNIAAEKFLSLGKRVGTDVAVRLQEQPFAVNFVQDENGGFHLYRFTGDENFLCLAPQLSYPLTLYTKTDAGSTWEIKENPLVAADSETCLQKLQASVDTVALRVVNQTDAVVSFVNDETNPWTVGDDWVENGNSGVRNSLSTLSFSYSSETKNELSFDWACYNYSDHILMLYIDGIYVDKTTNSTYKANRYYLDAGSHIISFQDSVGNNTYTQNWSKVNNICVKNILPLENYLLTEDSEPMKFENDGDWPWIYKDGYAQNCNYDKKETASGFSTTFTVTKPSKFSFYSSTACYSGNTEYQYNGYHYFDFKINGERYMGQEYGSGITSLMLEPGEYTMEWCDTIYSSTYYNFISKVNNIELSSNWIEVELAAAGSLGVEVLYQVNVLNDVELLKVKGNLNSTDWTSINNMKNIIALDLSEAKFDAVPEYAFDGLSYLSSVKLPDGVKTIGQYAFRGTQILNIDIPASVTSIGQYAFASTRVRTVNFTEDSKLQTIGYCAFSECRSLKEFIMPNTVTSLDTYNGYSDYECSTFYNCTSLEKIHFSNALTALEQYVCYDCNNLVDVVLPQNLQYIRDCAFCYCANLRHVDFPETLLGIDYYAFNNCALDSVKLPLKLAYLERNAFIVCDNLKYVELPSYIGSYNDNFYRCNAIETVVCRSATPPSISTDPFREGSAKGDITLVVPSFAVVNYKLDTYWCQFGSILEGENLDYWKITGALSLTNNRRMDGKPDIDLFNGGKLTVGGAAPMETGQFNYYPNVSNPASLLNDCQSMTADSVNTYYGVDANKWYFFTPVHDVDVFKISVSNSASYVIRYYDGENRAANGTGNSWKNVDSDKLLAGQGYIFQCNEACVLTLPCETANHHQMFVTTDITKQLMAYESTAAANKSWNYVGNPYPSYYDIYYMDFTSPITVWTGSTYKAYSIADDDFVLAPMQPFFVQKPDEVDNIVFHKEGRQHTSSIERPSYTKARSTEQSSRYFFDFQIMNDNEIIDETRVVINEAALLDYELTLDASKFLSINENVPQIFSFDSYGNNFAINERPIADGTVNLGYFVAEPGYYTISAIRTDGDVYLYDNRTGKTVDLTSQDYYFYSDETEEIDCSRFTLSLCVDDSNTTGVNVMNAQGIVVTGEDNRIRIITGEESEFQVFTTDGRCVCEKMVCDGVSYIDIPKGVYIVKVKGLIFKTIVF